VDYSRTSHRRDALGLHGEGDNPFPDPPLLCLFKNHAQYGIVCRETRAAQGVFKVLGAFLSMAVILPNVCPAKAWEEG
jgi:hypothetical protein